MATTVNVAFTGLCMFMSRNENIVDVFLPKAAESVEHCGRKLRPHLGVLIVQAKHLGVDPHHPNADQKVPLPAGDLEITATGGALSVPSDLASVTKLAGGNGRQQPGRQLARIALQGGTFVPQPKHCHGDPCSAPWTVGSYSGEMLRWQANWSGEIQADQLQLEPEPQGSAVVLTAVDGTIDFDIVNVMPMDVLEWLRPDGDTPSQSSPKRPYAAEDFCWFHWMRGLDAAYNVPVLEKSQNQAVRGGHPYTCLMARE